LSIQQPENLDSLFTVVTLVQKRIQTNGYGAESSGSIIPESPLPK